MMSNLNNELRKRIIDGNFKSARRLAEILDRDQLEEFIISQPYDKNEYIIFYFFLEDWALEVEDDKLFVIISTLMASCLNWMPGAYNVALRYLKMAIKMNPNDVYYKQFMLLFYEIPERLITLEEAVGYAKEVLEVLPNDKASLRIIKRIEKRKKNHNEPTK